MQTWSALCGKAWRSVVIVQAEDAPEEVLAALQPFSARHTSLVRPG